MQIDTCVEEVVEVIQKKKFEHGGAVYERDVSHCSPTKYAKDVTVAEVADAENSDNLVILRFNELGWQAVSTKAKNHHVGEKLFFIPVDSVLPFEMSEKLGVTKYLSSGRVKMAKLRGNRSEGLIVDKETVAPFIGAIMKWEDPPNVSMSGEMLPSKDIPFEFEVFYKMPNLLNEPDTFAPGESVFISEKIHGTNCRFGVLSHPETGIPTMYVGSHETVHRPDCSSVYAETVRRVCENVSLPEGYVFFGEIFGKNIQHLDYGKTVPALRVFAIAKRGFYLTPPETTDMCAGVGIECVRFTPAVFESVEQMRELSESPSEITDRHHREGIVIRSASDGKKMAKVIGTEYLSGPKRTERH